MRKIIPVLLLCFFVLSCAPRTVGPTDQRGEREEPKISATAVVDRFLSALKEQDYDKAYEYIHYPMTDREGFISRHRSLAEEHGIKLTSYRILGTQLFRDTGIIVAELDVSEISRDTGQVETNRRRIRYDMTVIKGEWRITREGCIENCR